MQSFEREVRRKSSQRSSCAVHRVHGQSACSPIVLSLFGVSFSASLNLSPGGIAAAVCVIGASMAVISIHDFSGMRKAYHESIERLKMKLKEEENKSGENIATNRLSFAKNKFLKVVKLKAGDDKEESSHPKSKDNKVTLEIEVDSNRHQL